MNGLVAGIRWFALAVLFCGAGLLGVFLGLHFHASGPMGEEISSTRALLESVENRLTELELRVESLTASPSPGVELDHSATPEEDPHLVAMKARSLKMWQSLTDLEGRTIRARVIQRSPQTLRIEREDGQIFEFPRSLLGEEDQIFFDYLDSSGTVLPSEPSANQKVDDTPARRLEDFDWDSIIPVPRRR